MHTNAKALYTVLGLATALSLPVFAQGDVGGAGPIAVVAIENEAAPRLIVDQPLPGPLAKGRSSSATAARTSASCRCTARARSTCRRALATCT